jgi:hypothetical protein
MFAFYSLAYIAGTFVILSPVIVLGCCVVKSDDEWKAESFTTFAGGTFAITCCEI